MSVRKVRLLPKIYTLFVAYTTTKNTNSNCYFSLADTLAYKRIVNFAQQLYRQLLLAQLFCNDNSVSYIPEAKVMGISWREWVCMSMRVFLIILGCCGVLFSKDFNCSYNSVFFCFTNLCYHTSSAGNSYILIETQMRCSYCWIYWDSRHYLWVFFFILIICSRFFLNL